MKLTLRHLRKHHPRLAWSARRCGLGWEYHGRQPGRNAPDVIFRAYSIADDYGDHARTEWRTSAESYTMWAMRQKR